MTPDLVIFDVDGTLHDAASWWHPVLCDGLQRFAAAAGIPITLPDARAACAVIGQSDLGVWTPFLPAAARCRWPELRDLVVPLECETLRAGDRLFPGMRELLLALRQHGVRTALASNCRSAYFAAVCDGQGLGALTDWQFCLDSPGVRDKTDMLRAAIAAAGAERAIMVGDRETDAAAARALGLPFVWRRNEHCTLAADKVWDGAPAELLAWLGFPPISSAPIESRRLSSRDALR